ncbi:hypothetical protein T4B_13109 [Trichinella pseudospiralis]|uniref:Uncharacterized protein n=1 Tax=Trichinella pseudospiralis TaxID=6337 RepID=A0A0V1IC81_TRIPS|nr:hypothetical protein T4B_13109 [Trichinella pseudospiralis]KRZ27306.1 hypothetical protein T4C_3621 [Trichinella pseudospiralis]
MITETKADWLLDQLSPSAHEEIYRFMSEFCFIVYVDERILNEQAVIVEKLVKRKEICELIVYMLRKSFFAAGSRAASQLLAKLYEIGNGMIILR